MPMTACCVVRRSGLDDVGVSVSWVWGNGDVVAAVSVVVPIETRTDTVLPAVRAGGRAISRALGRCTP